MSIVFNIHFLRFFDPNGPSKVSVRISDDEMSSNNLTALFFVSNTDLADSCRLDLVVGDEMLLTGAIPSRNHNKQN